MLAQAITGAPPLAEEPGLGPEQFKTLIRRRLALMGDEEIRHWLRTARGLLAETSITCYRFAPKAYRGRSRRSMPAAAGGDAGARQSTGGRAFDSVAAARPVRAARGRLFGYHDPRVPERILPIQFALDGEEFLRRFSEPELLYFHREEFP